MARPEGTVNPDLATGEIEVHARKLEVLNTCETPPFEIDDHVQVGQEMRLKYRFLDLRRPAMQHNIISCATRSAQAMRGVLERAKGSSRSRRRS